MSDAAVVFQPVLAANVPIHAGSTSFSATPTIAEINAASDLNQIIALINRRTVQTGVGGGSFSYLTGRYTASLINSLRTRVNAIRNAVALSSFSFGSAVNSGEKVKAQTFLDLRTALTFNGSMTIAKSAPVHGWTRTDSPWGTFISQSNALNISGTPTLIGKRTRVSGGTVGGEHRRIMLNFSIPASLGPGATCTLNIVLSNWASDFESPTPGVYASNTDDSAGSGSWWLNLDNFGSTGTAGSSSNQALSLPGSAVAARAGSNLSLVLGEYPELAGSGGIGAVNNEASAFGVVLGQSPGISLLLDFGF